MADTEEQPSISMTIDDVDEFSEEETVQEENPVEEEETVEENPVEEEPEEEQATVEENPVEEEPEEEQATVEENPVEEEPEEEQATVEENPVEEVPAEEEETVEEEDPEETVEEDAPVDEEPKSLNLRIAELDYLRECCGNWIGKKRAGKALFLKSWSEKDIKEDESVDYESLLGQLEKLPELVRGWANKSVDMKRTNHFKNLNGYSLQKPLFKEDFTVEEKVEILEKLITLLTDCAQGKLSVADIESQIDDYY